MPHGDGSITRSHRVVEAKITRTGEPVLRGTRDEVLEALGGIDMPEGGWTISPARPRVCAACMDDHGAPRDVQVVDAEACEDPAHDHSAFPCALAGVLDRTFREEAVARALTAGSFDRGLHPRCKRHTFTDGDCDDCAADIDAHEIDERDAEAIDALCGLEVSNG